MKKIIIVLSIVVLIIFSYFLFRTPERPSSPYTTYAQLIPGSYRIGFTNLDSQVSMIQLPVQGTIPSWLSGTLLRNGPAKFSTQGSVVSNWFDGLAMIHAFTISDGKVSYTNKFLKTSDYETVQKTGTMNYVGFMQDPCRSKFKQIFSIFFPTPFPAVPNANVNIAKYTDDFVALTEIPLPVIFNPTTLETLGVFDYTDQLAKSRMQDTAHPHYDPVRKEHLGYFTEFGRTSSLNLYKIPDGTKTRSIIASLEVAEPSYMHSFAITPRYAILTALPLVVRPFDLLKGTAFIKSFTWKPERGTQLIVIDRLQNSVVGSFKTEPFFAFHTVNAFEENNKIHLDIITYADATTLAEAYMNKLLGPQNTQTISTSAAGAAEPDAERTERGTLKRYTIDLATKQVFASQLSDAAVELPRINYDHYNGKNYRYVYGISKSNAPENPYIDDTLIKIDVTTGKTKTWHQSCCYPGEPIFIARPGSTQEDDGVVISIVLDAHAGTSYLLVLDAANFNELARAQAPHHIPFGIHGYFAGATT